MTQQQSGRIGRWRRESIKSLNQLCADALQLEDPPHNPPRGLLDKLRAPLVYPDFATATQELHFCPVVRAYWRYTKQDAGYYARLGYSKERIV